MASASAQRGVQKFIFASSCSDYGCQAHEDYLTEDFSERYRNKFVNAIHPAATISPTAELGTGVMVGAGAIVNTGAVVGDHVVINAGVSVSHDTVVGDFCNLNPGSVIAGTKLT